jgi:hypothetical protein
MKIYPKNKFKKGREEEYLKMKKFRVDNLETTLLSVKILIILQLKIQETKKLYS